MTAQDCATIIGAIAAAQVGVLVAMTRLYLEIRRINPVVLENAAKISRISDVVGIGPTP